MAGIAVLCEVQGGQVAKGSLGVLEEAARLGQALGEPVTAVVTGSGLDDAALAALGGHGAGAVVVADDPRLGSGLAQPVVSSPTAARSSRAAPASATPSSPTAASRRPSASS